MTSLIPQLFVVMMVVLSIEARRPFIPGKAKPVQQPSEPTQDTSVIDTNIADFERRMADVERSTTVMKREMEQVTTENRRLREEIRSMSGLMTNLEESQKRTQELQQMLTKFENFFGVLYTELPDVFSREMKIEKRMSALNEFLGNKEAELMALRGNPPVEPAAPGEFPIDEELLGTAMRQMSSENAKLKFRLDGMETRMNEPVVDREATTFNGGAPDDDDTAERLQRLERLVALQLAPQLDEEEDLDTLDFEENPVLRMSPGDATTTYKRLALSDSDTEILRDELNSVRSVAITRKSMFSAASTRHSFGEDRIHKAIDFDHVFVNKGNHFQEHNSTFICKITGFYFITYTVRSYDHRYLGVNLLMNGDRVTSISGEPDPEKNQMMTQSVVLHLNVGDQLWLTISPSNIYGVYSDHSRYCTFSGFLIFKGS